MANNNEEFVTYHDVQELADRIIKQYDTRKNISERMLVGIAGRPGSGKTTLANIIASVIYERSNNAVRVTVMPMDGYHFYREELSRFPNAEYAFSRRGAYWTMNSEKLYKDLVRIKDGGMEVTVPSFDHALKDPIENDTVIPTDVDIVLVEGNFLLYTKDPVWKKVSEMFEFKVFLECEPAECTERLTQRHMKAWGISREEAMLRAKGSDFKNGNLIDTTRENADVMCHSNSVFLHNNSTQQSLQ